MNPAVFISPSKYVQGAGAIFTLGEHVRSLGCKNALVCGGTRGLYETRRGRETGFADAETEQTELLFSGESTDIEIERITEAARGGCFDILIACGGGKVIDAVKAAAVRAGIKCAVVPTVASNDAPCSSLSVIYNADGTMNRLCFNGRNPDIVLADTEIIARAPRRQLVSGMGDALATWYEAEAGARLGTLNVPGGKITGAALALARLCRDTLFEYGLDAARACEQNTVTPALEHVVEANILLSGLGFESGAVYLAHGLSEGLHLVPGTHSHTHGELVAFGLLAQLIIDGQPRGELERVLEFSRSVGLPVKLRDIGAAAGEDLRRACAAAVRPESPANMLDADAVYAAVLAADAL